MANVRLVFNGTKRSDTQETELDVFANASNEIYISIEDNHPQHICLDRETAIRLVKELKKQIGYLNS